MQGLGSIQMTNMAPAGALEGILVADFTQVMAGPYCTMTLADMGADVVKVEPPQGDPTRGLMADGTGGESPFFLCLNRNKRSVVLDLKSPAGREAALDLVSRADILAESFQTGVMDRFGLGYAELSARFPRLVYCSVSAYGRTGPFAGRAGYDPIVQGETGLMDLNGEAGREPHKTGIPIIDLGTGMFAAQAVLAALFARSHSGRGQFIDVPLFDTAVALSSYHTVSYLRGGEPPERLGNKSRVAAPVGLYHAADGAFFTTVAGERVWKKFVEAVGGPAELADPRFATNALRVQHQEALDQVLEPLIAAMPCAHWLARFTSAGVPAGPVRTIAEAVRSPEMAASGVIVEAPHASLGAVPNLRLPMAMSGTPLAVRRSAPLLGEHTREVLGSVLGYHAARIEALTVSGTVSNSAGNTA